MKKILATVLLCGALSVFMIGCSSSDDSASDESESTEETTEQESTDAQTFDVGDTWTVDDNWNLTINSVEATDERDNAAEADLDYDPSQVIVISYTYENLGYDNEDGDITGLFMDLSTCTLVDADGNECSAYPVSGDKEPKETAINQSCSAQAAFALKDEGKTATLTVSQTDNGDDVQSAKFNLSWD